ncbi:MAG: hypothetical protein QM749_15930 [Aquabacterium sp.]
MDLASIRMVRLGGSRSNLLSQKKTESRIALGGMILLAVLMLCLLKFELSDLRLKISSPSTNLTVLLAASTPIAAIELLFIYFFRVILSNYHSIRKQMLQIELRKSLCEFIQSYADYAKGIKEKDKTALEKFENLIFSGIVMDDQNLPSTFDGLEQIAKLIEAAKGARK